MYEVYDDELIETRHIFVLDQKQYEEYVQPVRWNMLPIPLLLVAYFLLTTSFMNDGPFIISVPLHILPPQMFSTSTAIVPTGKSIVPATSAQGVITVYNGLTVMQQLSKGAIVLSSSGIEVVTDEGVLIPAAHAPQFGIASVHAHAVIGGATGNITIGSINESYGASMTLINLTAFSGGADSYTVPTATDDDKQHALVSARQRLHQVIDRQLLYAPCGENVTGQAMTMTVVWLCQFVRYTVPAGLHVLSVQRGDKSVILQVSRL